MDQKVHNQLRQILTFKGNAMNMPFMERSPKTKLKLFCQEVAVTFRMRAKVLHFVGQCKWIINRFEAQIRMTRAKHEMLI